MVTVSLYCVFTTSCYIRDKKMAQFNTSTHCNRYNIKMLKNISFNCVMILRAWRATGGLKQCLYGSFSFHNNTRMQGLSLKHCNVQWFIWSCIQGHGERWRLAQLSFGKREVHPVQIAISLYCSHIDRPHTFTHCILCISFCMHCNLLLFSYRL